MEMISVTSSAIDAVGYDEVSCLMRIKFSQGETYTYCRVPSNIFLGLLRATSKGQYYAEIIKDKFDC